MPLYEIDGHRPTLPGSGHHFIADTAAVIGRVAIGEHVSIWFGAVLRGDSDTITIGDGSNVQDNCTLHADPGFPLTVGKNCTVGHNVILHGCTIGDGTLIGMGAIIMNGVRIGRNCIVGAGAVVTEGKEFPDGSLIVGAPAKTIRALDQAAIQTLGFSAEHYQANGRRFARGLTRIG